MTGMIRRAAGQIASLYRGSRSYRAVARSVIFLTLVSMALGYITGLPTGGSAIGDVILVVVSTALVVVWLGIVLWALAAFWRVRDLQQGRRDGTASTLRARTSNLYEGGSFAGRAFDLMRTCRARGSPRRTTSARTTASLCSASRAEKTSVSVPSRACRRSSVSRGR
jgi:hypothetical protein